MSEIEFRAAIRDAIAEEIERDSRVVFFGEDVAAAGGVFVATPGLAERFGEERVFDTPISELALAGAAFGAAVTGQRPIFEIMFGDFMALPMDSLVNQAAKFWYISNEQGSVPLVVRSAVGGGGRFGAIHSQTHGTWFQGMRADMTGAVRMPTGWNRVLGAAGLSGVTAFSYLVDVPAPLSEAGRDAVVSWLTWMTHGTADLLSPDDLAALHRLLDPADPAYVARRDDVFMLKASTVHIGWR